MTWKSMDSAPKDGTRILALCPEDGVITMAWCKTYSCWWQDPTEAFEYDPEKRHPTKWMKLPPK